MTSHPVTGPQEALTRVHAMAYGGAITTIVLFAAGIILLVLGVDMDNNRAFYAGLAVLGGGITSTAVTASLYSQRTCLGQVVHVLRTVRHLMRVEDGILSAASGDDELARRRRNSRQ